jgi:phage terminase large subunit-like protein
MTVPHPQAKGSLGAEFAVFAERRSGLPLRWWQRLVAKRLLEIDKSADMVWETLMLKIARHLGKSWLLRELVLWSSRRPVREPQNVVHTGKDLRVCQEVQMPARRWAKQHPGVYRVREASGQESIEYLADGSRWVLVAKEAAYGQSTSVVAVDEAWKVRPFTVADSLAPTMVEREQAQLWLISTAHRLATLMRAAGCWRRGARGRRRGLLISGRRRVRTLT